MSVQDFLCNYNSKCDCENEWETVTGKWIDLISCHINWGKLILVIWIGRSDTDMNDLEEKVMSHIQTAENWTIDGIVKCGNNTISSSIFSCLNVTDGLFPLSHSYKVEVFSFHLLMWCRWHVKSMNWNWWIESQLEGINGNPDSGGEEPPICKWSDNTQGPSGPGCHREEHC